MNVLEKNLLVLASAGSGKTHTLSDRIIGLVASGVEPRNVVALTFTRKAAGEFAEAILKKLAEAAEDPIKAKVLGESFGMEGADFHEILEKVIRQLPKLTLGTMDQFFSRIIRSFQYELGVTGGKFDLLEGEAGESAKDELLEGLLEDGLGGGLQEEFLNMFRRATAGKEGTQVIEELRDFIKNWHQVFLSNSRIEWGPAGLSGVAVEDWEKQKAGLIEQVRRDWPNLEFTHGKQKNAIEPILAKLEAHTISSGSLGKPSKLLEQIMSAAAEAAGPLEVSFQKPFRITGLAAQALRELIELAARCELAAALSRTRGVRELITAYDAAVERELRSKGRLGFDDVKRLMGEWMEGEEARLRREAVDFRLDASYQHWLLDEFQDTSREDWRGLQPLIDEAVSDPHSSVFIVGDKKQGIFAWRGGDVGLFDEVGKDYAGGLVTETMAKSWRSCPEVLGLVNRVCGDLATMRSLFGNATDRWQWEEHVSAPRLSDPKNAGHARVEIVEKDSKQEAVIALLKDLGIGRRQLSCGMLVRTNKQVGEWADLLRNEGFDVVEEGAREPAKDHPVGVMIWQFLRWLADPSDDFARRTVEMSPLGPELEKRYGTAWQAAWEQIGGVISEGGIAPMLEDLLAPLLENWTAFGKRRSIDLTRALEEIDNEGAIPLREVADRIGKLKITQSPGMAAVQVMTVHKSKGLGFDVVVLPDMGTDKIPDFGHLKTIQGDGWVTDAPASWVRTMIPELRVAETAWSDQQTYEAFCKLYVALTRAKRGLYVFLDEPAKSAPSDKASIPNWIMNTLGFEGSDGEVFEIGNPGWAKGIPTIETDQQTKTRSLGPAISKRDRSTPSGGKEVVTEILKPGLEGGRKFGTEVHAAFEHIGWLDEEAPPRFSTTIRETMEAALAVPEIRGLFEKRGRDVSLFREQRVETVMEGKWMSGVIDRLHVIRNSDGVASIVEIIDFKTDRVKSASELTKRYSGQMRAYENAMAAIYPKADVRSILLSTALKSLI